MWYRAKRYPKGEILVDPEGQIHRLRSIQKKYKIKYTSSNTTGMDLSQKAKLSLLQKLIRGNVPSSFDNRQTSQTRTASSPDKIAVDFHIDAIFRYRTPKHVSIVTDTNRKDFLAQEKQMRQRKDDERFEKEVEVMRVTKRLQVLQDSYRRRGIAI